MDILSYLSELIQTRKAVGISGLGTLLKIKIPGKYDAETHSFLPPSFTLEFTADLQEQVLLADFISKKRNVSVETANYFISEFSEELQQQLKDHQETSFGDLGKLVKADGGVKLVPAIGISYGFDFYGLPAVKEEQESLAEEISSQTSDAEELLPLQAVEEPTIESVIAENEGLEENPGSQAHPVTDSQATNIPVSGTPVYTELDVQPKVPAKNEEQLQKEIEALNAYRSKLPYLKDSVPVNEEVIWNLNAQTVVPAQTVTPDQAAAPVKEQVAVKPVTDPWRAEPSAVDLPQEEEPKTIPAYAKILLGILILLIMMATAYFVKPEWFNGLTGTSPAPVQKVIPVTPKKTDSIPAADTTLKDSIQEKKVTTTAPAAVKDSAIKEAAKAAPVKPLDTTTVYEIIGASMHDQKEADNFIALMKKSGVTAKVVTNMSGRKLKISIATLKDEASAKLELDRLSKKLKIPGIYIYRNKQK